MIEEEEEQIQVETTSNYDLNEEAKSETNNETVNEEAHTELDGNTMNEDERIVESGNIDEKIGSQLSDDKGEGITKENGGDDDSKGKVEENEGGDGVQEDVEEHFQEVLDHLGVVSVHHDGYIRFWNFEVFLVSSYHC